MGINTESNELTIADDVIKQLRSAEIIEDEEEDESEDEEENESEF